jgi:CHAD domain-containing protein
VLSRPGFEPDITLPCPATGDRPLCCHDLPEGPFRDALRPVIDVRAVMPLVTIVSSMIRQNVVNEDEKTVSHINTEKIHVSRNAYDKKTMMLIEVAPVRGYTVEFNDIIEKLEETGLEREEGNIFSIALAAVGAKAGVYSSKPVFTLEPDMSSQEALRIIFRALLRIMNENEDGVAKDIDTEFLHDFRVAVRRTRSALTLTKGVFPAKTIDGFKTDFRALGWKSNELRDLDIYLQRRERYTEMLPPALRPGLGLLFNMITRERKEALRVFTEELNSDSYRRLISSWEEFLHAPEENGDDAEPVIVLAKSRIRKRYKKAVKLGKGIDESSSDRDLHTLRIECKKLRYYLEFFESLFPATEIKEVIAHLKRLQDNLGDYNDMHVQQERLKGYIPGMDPAADEGRDGIAAAGGLISELYLKQREIRSEFHERFGEFSGSEMKSLFDNLFSGN